MTCSCLLIFTRWQTGQDVTNFFISRLMPGLKYLTPAILMVCCWPAWVYSCSTLIAACLKAGGKRRTARVLTSGGLARHRSLTALPFSSARKNLELMLTSLQRPAFDGPPFELLEVPLGHIKILWVMSA